MSVPLGVPLVATGPTIQVVAPLAEAPPPWDRPLRDEVALPRDWTSIPVPSPPPPRAWAEVPVAAQLHPVAYDYGVRYQALLARSMGGSGASPVFGPTVAEADVHWRLVAATGVGLPIDAVMAERWSTMAASGALMAAQSLLDETMARSPGLHIVWVAADAVVNPSLRIRKTPHEVRVDHPTGKIRRDYERAGAELDELPRDDRPRPSLDLGLDWTPREMDAPEDSPAVTWKARLAVQDLVLSSMRVDVGLEDLSWGVSGREKVAPHLFLVGSLRGDAEPTPKGPARLPDLPDTGPEPGRWAAGVMWELPYVSGWTVRVERIVTLAQPQTTWMMTFRSEGHTPVPVRPDRPAHVASTPLPELRERDPNVLVRW